MKQYLDKGFEIIMAGMKAIDAVAEAHRELYGDGESEPKGDHPSTFEHSLHENEEQYDKRRGSRFNR